MGRVIVKVGNWEMLVPSEVAEDVEARAKVVAVLRMIGEIENDEGESE